MTLQYWVLSDVSLFVTASMVIFNFSAISWTAFLFASLIPYCCTICSLYRTSTACRTTTQLYQRRPGAMVSHAVQRRKPWSVGAFIIRTHWTTL